MLARLFGCFSGAASNRRTDHKSGSAEQKEATRAVHGASASVLSISAGASACSNAVAAADHDSLDGSLYPARSSAGCAHYELSACYLNPLAEAPHDGDGDGQSEPVAHEEPITRGSSSVASSGKLAPNTPAHATLAPFYSLGAVTRTRQGRRSSQGVLARHWSDGMCSGGVSGGGGGACRTSGGGGNGDVVKSGSSVGERRRSGASPWIRPAYPTRPALDAAAAGGSITQRTGSSTPQPTPPSPSRACRSPPAREAAAALESPEACALIHTAFACADAAASAAAAGPAACGAGGAAAEAEPCGPTTPEVALPLQNSAGGLSPLQQRRSPHRDALPEQHAGEGAQADEHPRLPPHVYDLDPAAPHDAFWASHDGWAAVELVSPGAPGVRAASCDAAGCAAAWGAPLQKRKSRVAAAAAAAAAATAAVAAPVAPPASPSPPAAPQDAHAAVPCGGADAPGAAQGAGRSPRAMRRVRSEESLRPQRTLRRTVSSCTTMSEAVSYIFLPPLPPTPGAPQLEQQQQERAKEQAAPSPQPCPGAGATTATAGAGPVPGPFVSMHSHARWSAGGHAPPPILVPIDEEPEQPTPFAGALAFAAAALHGDARSSCPTPRILVPHSDGGARAEAAAQAQSCAREEAPVSSLFACAHTHASAAMHCKAAAAAAAGSRASRIPAAASAVETAPARKAACPVGSITRAPAAAHKTAVAAATAAPAAATPRSTWHRATAAAAAAPSGGAVHGRGGIPREPHVLSPRPQAQPRTAASTQPQQPQPQQPHANQQPRACTQAAQPVWSTGVARRSSVPHGQPPPSAATRARRASAPGQAPPASALLHAHKHAGPSSHAAAPAAAASSHSMTAPRAPAAGVSIAFSSRVCSARLSGSHAHGAPLAAHAGAHAAAPVVAAAAPAAGRAAGGGSGARAPQRCVHAATSLYCKPLRPALHGNSMKQQQQEQEQRPCEEGAGGGVAEARTAASDAAVVETPAHASVAVTAAFFEQLSSRSSGPFTWRPLRELYGHVRAAMARTTSTRDNKNADSSGRNGDVTVTASTVAALEAPAGSIGAEPAQWLPLRERIAWRKCSA